LAFAGGFFLIGLLDAFHSHTGVQFYLVSQFNITDQNWPWFIPLQMGLAGLFLLYSWHQLLPLLCKQFFGLEKRRGPGPKFLFPWSAAMIVFGYGFSWAVNEIPSHLGYYMGLYIGSLLYLLLLHSRHQIAAFMLCGLAGITFETLLLDPEIGYYEFFQKDFFGRSPGWLLFVYGWVGIFIHELYRLTHPISRPPIEVPEEYEEDPA
jgi:hypothetical protein